MHLVAGLGALHPPGCHRGGDATADSHGPLLRSPPAWRERLGLADVVKQTAADDEQLVLDTLLDGDLREIQRRNARIAVQPSVDW